MQIDVVKARLSIVSPLLTLYRLCSFLLVWDLEPERRSCQVKGVPDDWDKTAQADAANIDKGLTLKPSQKGIGL
ncbi:hypothetical protein [Rhizobium sp. Leaf262]|uniref:hypothetical protein n=1 Tax=Rhizobium sp. Leaf262 TaxID=1736312 RepID=UPI0007138BCC|nr:hypothetical protein [Rhizobium sp. Leaf262]KQO75980.1 hypothetical protein ASF29_12450 [Rhizobium sp. Leaf262]